MIPTIAEKVQQHFSQFPHHSYPKGQILVFANESPEHIYYLTKGQVRKYDLTYRGDEVIVNTFKAGSFFPMSWALNKTPNKYFYRTETDTELHLVPNTAAVQFLEANPDVTLDLLKRVYRGSEGMLGRMVQLMAGTARSRLIYELVIEGRRFGRKRIGGSLLTASEIDLAARSGLSRETVSREMQKLKAHGWVSLTSQGILVKNFDQLEKALGSKAEDRKQ